MFLFHITADQIALGIPVKDLEVFHLTIISNGFTGEKFD